MRPSVRDLAVSIGRRWRRALWSPSVSRRRATGRRSGRRGRWRRARSSSRRTRCETLANGLQVIAVSHHEQPAVSLRLLIRAGGARDPNDKPGVAALAAAVLDQGTTTRSAEQIADDDRFDRRRHRGRVRHRPLVRPGDRDEGQPQPGARPRVRHRAQPGVRAGGDRAAAPADALRPQGQLRRSGVSRGRGVRPARLRLPPLRPAGCRHAGVDRRDHAPGSGRVPQALVRAEQRDPRHRRRRLRGRGVCRRGARVRQVGPKSESNARVSRRNCRRRPAGSSSSIARAPCRRKSASATRGCRASTPTTSRSISRSRSSAAKGATGCTACCGPSAASPTARRPT